LSLKDDMDALERAISAGKGREFLEGSFSLPPARPPIDPSTRERLSLYNWLVSRGD